MQNRSWKYPAALFAGVIVLATLGCRGPLGAGSSAPPDAATLSPVKRLVVVVLQNSSFDHMFAMFPGVQDPLTPASKGFSQTDSSGATVTAYLETNPFLADLPHGHTSYVDSVDNGAMDGFAKQGGSTAMSHYDDTIPGVDIFWGFAKQFALADNYFSSVLSSAPTNPLYLVAATDNDFAFGTQPFFGPCNQADPAAKPFTFPNVGDEMDQKGIQWGWFHDNYGVCGDYVPQQNPFQYFSSTQNTPHLQDMTAFDTAIDAGTLPSVSFLNPGGGRNCHPGNSSISTCGQFLSKLITHLQMSPAWSSMAVVVFFDEGGGFYDHVTPPVVDTQGYGIRVPMLVISPLAKTGYISHVQMDHVSILRFIQWNWSLPSLNARNNVGGATIELRDMFNF